MTKDDEIPKLKTTLSQSRLERLVSVLRRRTGIEESLINDEDLLALAIGKLIYAASELEIAQEDFGKVAKPIVEKIANDIKRVFSKIRMPR